MGTVTRQLILPQASPEAITVGATNRFDSRAEFSNYGSTLDLFAPGVSIPSAWIGSDLMIATATGTSMAAPHVAGVVALYLQTHRSASPADGPLSARRQFNRRCSQ